MLLSGGLDSSILLGDFLRKGRQILPIYVDSGLIWQEVELACLLRFLRAMGSDAVTPLLRLNVPLADVYQDHWSLTGNGIPDAESADRAVDLPGRNALLLVKAALACRNHGVGDLALGVLGTSPFADARPEFFAQFIAAMNTALGMNLRIHLPFAEATKQEVMQLGQDLPLEWTFSCVAPLQQLHCGRCNKCVERQHAFQQVEMEDPTEYASDHLLGRRTKKIYQLDPQMGLDGR